MAIIEHTGVYVRCKTDQTRFLPQGDVSELYDVNNHRGLNKVKTSPGTNYGQTCATDRHPNRLFWKI